MNATRLRDSLYPFGLFLIFALLGTNPRLNYLLAPVHELGHVLAAFLTGGYGAFRWDEALVYGGHPVVIDYAGSFFELAVYGAFAIVLLVYHKAYWIAGFLAGATWNRSIAGSMGSDFEFYAQEYPFMPALLRGLGVVLTLIITAVFLLLLYRTLTKVKNTR